MFKSAFAKLDRNVLKFHRFGDSFNQYIRSIFKCVATDGYMLMWFQF